MGGELDDQMQSHKMFQKKDLKHFTEFRTIHRKTPVSEPYYSTLFKKDSKTGASL